jgi:ribose transport system substrate-binding protein
MAVIQARRVGAAGIAVSALLVLTACGSSKGSGDKTLTYLPGVAGDNFYISVECSARAEAKKLGYSLDVQAPQKWDATLQRPILDAAIAKKPGALIVTPTDESSLQTSLEQAKRDGIKVVLSDTTTKDPTVAASAVTADNVVVGEKAFEALKNAYPHGGRLLVIGSAPGVSTGDDRVKGFKKAVASARGFTLVGVQYAQDDNAKAAQLTAAALQKNPDIVGVFGVSGNETQGAATAVRQAGLQGKTSVVGVDAYPAQVKALESGDVLALIAQDVNAVGTQSVLQAVNAVEGKTVKEKVLTGSIILTKKSLSTAQGKATVYKTKC